MEVDELATEWVGRAGTKPAGGWLRPALAAVLLLLQGAGAWTQTRPTEYEVKAAYLLNFGRFTRYAGAAPQRPHFDICILGRDPFGRVMDDIAAHESIDNVPVRVLRITDATQGRSCAIVFISVLESERMREDLAILGGSDTLTVSDAPDFIAHGGMIQLTLQGDHVRFEVNLDAVNRNHLELSSELLRVAASVKGGPQRGAR
jgi:YfiR/HmsC-like